MTIRLIDRPLPRRSVLKAGTSAAGVAAFAGVFRVQDAFAAAYARFEPDPVAGPNVRFRFGVCQNCHSRCGLLGRIVDGRLVKLDGNPYHPNNMEEDERLPYATPVDQAVRTPGRLCPKGQAGVQVLYDPYRVKHPMKRVGARGAGQWQTISWAQAFQEIAAQISTLIPTSTRLSQRIDPAVPELGPIANQLLFSPGRFTDGEIGERIFKNTYGTQNYRLDHTSICEVSHHVQNELMTWDEAGSKGRKSHFKPDLANAEFVIVFGANYLEANFPMLAISRKTVEMKARGGKLAVVDPRFSNTASKADWWVPALPGTDGAVALGVAWSIMDALPGPAQVYLRNANAAAAAANGAEKTWTDMTRLVVTAVSGAVPATVAVGRYLRVQDWKPASASSNTSKTALAGGVPAEIAAAAVVGDLFGSYTFDSTNSELASGASITAKPVYQILKERVYDGKSVGHYARIAGVDESLLTTLAGEFMAHGRRSVANHYRGTVQHTNGFYAAGAVQLLNVLAGNFDWKGGYSAGGGSWAFNSGMTGTGASGVPSGPRIDRTKVSTSLYPTLVTKYPGRYAFPAKRPWFPFGTHGNFQEVIPSILGGYPYPCKVLITYWNAWPYSTPGLRDVFARTVSDPSKVPLFVAIDNQIGEVSAYADYILPDTTYLEKWSFPGMTPTIQTRATSLREPLVGSFDAKPWDADFDPAATNAYTPVLPDTKMVEDILLGLMSALGLTQDLGGTALPANAWAHVKKGVENLATSSGRSVADILAKGGAFEDPGNSYDGEYLKYPYGNEVKVWSEQLARTVDSMGNGAATFDGLMPQYVPVADIRGSAVPDDAYPYQLVTYKKVLHAQARTIALPWLTTFAPTNHVELSAADAATLGIRNGDPVRISSASSPMGTVGRALVTEGVRPGVVAVAHSFGHWQMGSKPRSEDGVQQSYDANRAAGIQSNVVMRLDPVLGDVSLQDKIGASCSFNDTRVRIEKAN